MMKTKFFCNDHLKKNIFQYKNEKKSYFNTIRNKIHS